MSLCKLVQHWNGNVVFLMAFSSLVALKVVTLTTFSATSDENFIKMMTFLFQWKAISKQHCYGIQKQHWPSTKAILTQHKSDTGPVQKQYWPGTKAIPFDTVFSTVTQRVCTGSTGTRYKSGTGIRYRYVYRNGVQDVYRKVPYRYLVPYTTIPNRYHLPPLNSTGTGTDRYPNVYCGSHRNTCRCICQIILKLCQEHGSDIASLCSKFQKKIWQMTNNYGSTKFNEIWFNNVITVITSAFNVSITDRCSTEDANRSSATQYLVGHFQLCSQISESGSELIWNAKQRV